MFEDIPINQLIKNKDVLKAAKIFLKKVFTCVNAGMIKKPKAQTIKEIGFTPISYEDVKSDKDGWIDATKFAPSRFDIVTLKTKSKTENGWYNGQDWYSRKWKSNPKVICWKQTKENFVGGPKDAW